MKPEVAESLKFLWSDAGVRQCVSKAYEYQLNDSAKYFFDNMDRILSSNFTPNVDDVLRARVRTTGIIETNFRVGDVTYRMFDVGGQRSERRKWIQVINTASSYAICHIGFLAIISHLPLVLLVADE
jgi:hypothetical protein